MAGPQLHAVLGHLRQLNPCPGSAERTDRQLLDAFISGQDAAAFETLVRRHGALVLRVCRRVLHHEQDAEDAFQATFIVLARKAASIRKSEAVASWLHQVAYHVASKARRGAARRRTHESQVQPMTPKAPSCQLSWHEVQEVIHQEIQRLPETWRAAFVLCVLENKSRPEAAQQLGWKEGTVSSRLSRARERLRQRLARRGVSLTAVLAELALSESATNAASALLTGSTARAALAVAAGEPVSVATGSARIAALVSGATRAMLAGRLKTMAVLVLTLGMVTTGIGALAWQTQGTKQDEPNRPAQAGQQPGPEGGKQVTTDQHGDSLPAGVLARMGTLRFRQDQLTSLAFHPGGKWLASSGYDGGKAIVWDLASGKELRCFKLYQAGLHSVCFAPHDKTLLGHGGDGTIYVWDLKQGKLVQAFGLRQEAITCWALSPSGKTLATGSHDFRGVNHTLHFWNLDTGKEVYKLPMPRSAMAALTFAPDGKWVAAAADDGSIHIQGMAFQADGNTCTWKVPVKLPGGRQWPLEFTPDGKALALGGPEAIIRLMEASTGKEIRLFKGHTRGVTALAFLPGGKVLASAAMDNTVRLWEVATGKELRVLRGAGSLVAVSPDGQMLASAGNGAIRLWDAATGAEIRPTGGHRSAIWSVAYSPSGSTLATASLNGTVRLWDAATGKELSCIKGRHNGVRFMPDGKTVVAGGYDKVIRLLDVATGKEVRQFLGHAGQVSAVAVSSCRPAGFGESATGWLLASGATDNTIRLWDTATGKELRRWQAKGKNGMRLCFSPEGKLLASVAVNDLDFDVYLWDVATGKEVRRLKGHKNILTTVAFSRDGRLLASAGIADAIRLWDVATGKPLAAIPREQTATGQTCQVLQVVFSADGRTVASAEADGVVRLWEVATGKLRRELNGHSGAVYAVAMSADNRLASAGADTTALIWGLTGRRPQDLQAAWNKLVGADATAAYQAVMDLAAAGKPAVALLAAHLKPVPTVDLERISQLVADLNNPTFAIREKAQAELETLADLPEPALRKALAKSTSEELRRRVERILGRASVKQLHHGRALEVLERMANPEARRLLETLAAGAPPAWLTREARAAVQRIARQTAR